MLRWLLAVAIVTVTWLHFAGADSFTYDTPTNCDCYQTSDPNFDNCYCDFTGQVTFSNQNHQIYAVTAEIEAGESWSGIGEQGSGFGGTPPTYTWDQCAWQHDQTQGTGPWTIKETVRRQAIYPEVFPQQVGSGQVNWSP